MRVPVPLRLAGIGILSLLAACSGDARAAAPMVRDSAGVRIVENTAPAWKEGEGWKVSPEPRVDIGVTDGAPEYQFGRVTGAVRLSDGRIVVADGQAKQLRFFDREGRHLRTVGREGGGPGEFLGDPEVLSLPGDSVGTWEIPAARFSVFGPGGDFARERSLKPKDGMMLVRVDGVFADGSLLAAPFGSLDFRPDDRGVRDTIPILRYPAAGTAADTLGRFPGAELVTVQGEGSDGSWTIRGAVPFGRNTFRTARGEFAYVADNERLAVALYGSDGKLRRVIRATHQPEPLTPEEVARYREEKLASIGTGPGRGMQEGLLKATPFPETKSAFAGMLVDSEGAVWLRGHTIGSNEPVRWTVFDAEGRLMGKVEMPEGFRVTEIGRDYVLGIWTDDLDVQHVRLHGLERSDR